MTEDGIVFRPIGIIRTEHTDPGHTPIQPRYAAGCAGRVEVYPEFTEGLGDLERFTHIYLLYHLDRARPPQLRIQPYLQDTFRGLFATRAPHRPNPIGLSIVRLVRREGPVVHVDGVDMLDGSPLLDIKPYAGRFDRIEEAGSGWLDEVDDATAERRGKRK